MTVLSGLNLRLLLVFIIAVLAGFGAWQNRERRGSKSLTAFLAVLAVLVAAHLLAHLAGPFELLFIKLRWTGLFALPFFVLTFALVFTRRDGLLTPLGLVAVFAVPAFVAIFLWTPTVLGLVGVGIDETVVMAFLNEEGPIYIFTLAVAYLALLAASALLLHHSYQVHSRFRRQQWILAGGILVLWLGTAIEVFGFVRQVHVHWVQNSFLVFGLAVLWSVYRGGVTDISPTARSRIIETLDVAIIVIDDRGYITDMNPAAERLLTADDRQIVGASVSEVLADQPSLLDAFDGNSDEQIELGPAGDRRVVSPNVTPLEGPNGDEIGRVMLLYDVTELRRQRDELHRKNERLDEFAKVVSHDLRNPLSVALARLDLAKEDSESEHLEQVESSLEQMATMIDDLFDLATAGEDIGSLEPLDLAAIVEGCWRRVQTGDAELINETDITVQADKTRLQQLLTNLIQNAIEHGGNAVTVRVGNLDDGFYVEDDGLGIPADPEGEVLEPGYSSSQDGTGFGLSIVRDVAHAHGWEISVNESDQGGARFEFIGVESN